MRLVVRMHVVRTTWHGTHCTRAVLICIITPKTIGFPIVQQRPCAMRVPRDATLCLHRIASSPRYITRELTGRGDYTVVAPVDPDLQLLLTTRRIPTRLFIFIQPPMRFLRLPLSVPSTASPLNQQSTLSPSHIYTYGTLFPTRTCIATR